ncbi:MAG: PIN domain-containing protein [Acidobacteria bacterium]|nr:PIN domain-containing protein [Acidobacteriota bacterium]
MILLDAGPMIAILHRDDSHHDACVKVLRGLSEPMLTVWPAVTEAMYLLGFSTDAQQRLWEFLGSDAIAIAELDKADFPRMRELMDKYSDLPMDLADAALVRVAERERLGKIFTIDRRDFEIYRPADMRRFRILP